MDKEAATKWGSDPASAKADSRLRPKSNKTDTKPSESKKPETKPKE
jgi:hypothetical protein